MFFEFLFQLGLYKDKGHNIQVEKYFKIFRVYGIGLWGNKMNF